MDFFAHQDDARRKSTQLVVLFVIAVIAVVVVTYLAVATVWAVTAAPQTIAEEALAGAPRPSSYWDLVLQPKLMLQVGSLTLGVIAMGSLYKLFQLRSGGRAVAQSLGGRFLSPNTTDTDERRLLNVVEEMSIASGIPMPEVCLLDEEDHINAFAAGFSPETAVIGVTRGALEKLSRDELQGVIAHEYSHILHGDMQLNLKLIGVLHGILVIGLIGQGVLRAIFRTGGGRRSSNRKGDNGAVVAIAALALALMIIGYVGTFFGNLIKAAVSRQREFLADAASVQFTRNPDGIGGALQRIAKDGGAVLESPSAPSASHMFFGDGLRPRFLSLLATHPPVSERLARIQATPLELKAAPAAGGRAPSPLGAGAMGFAAGGAAEAPPGKRPPPARTLSQAVGTIGAPGPDHVRHAAGLLASLPGVLRASAQETFTARAMVFATLLAKDPSVRARQLAALESRADSETYSHLVRIAEPTLALSREAHIALLELSVPALRLMSDAQFSAFQSQITLLVQADDRVDLFEWMLERLLERHVTPAFRRTRPPRVRHHALGPVRPSLTVLLSTLSRISSRDEAHATRAFAAAQTRVGEPLALLAGAECTLPALNQALDELDGLAPQLKRVVLEAAAAAITADGLVTSEEAQLLRAVSDALGCPMPPVLGVAAA